MTEQEQSGTLYTIAAPSGAGKTSLVKALIETTADIGVSISHTTRAMRPGEIDGVHYHFIDSGTFKQMVAQGNFVEHAQVHHNYYGTSRQALADRLAVGEDVILEIDWQGARQIRAQFPQMVGIFILPPSRTALEERLRGRGQDNAEVIAQRMRNASGEMRHYDEFDYLVINSQFDQALSELRAIVVTHRLLMAQQNQRHAGLLRDLLA